MRYNLFDPDATSRVANADYVISKAVTCTCLRSDSSGTRRRLRELPFFSWHGGGLRSGRTAWRVSCRVPRSMAAAALMVRRIALDRAVGTGWRRLAAVCFALQPMVPSTADGNERGPETSPCSGAVRCCGPALGIP